MRTLLLDADILAYKIAARCEEVYGFDPDDPCVVVDEAAARRQCDEVVGEYCDLLAAGAIRVCLTDPQANFRKQLEATYKANRKDAKKPQLLSLVKHYLAHEYQSFIRPRLEADDIMGILATSGDRFIAGDKIMVSEDKDMRTIPGLLFNPNRPELGVIEVSELDADRFHMWQTICGDATDGYTGCPRLGEKCEWAQDVIGADRDELWEIVTDAYDSKGLPESAAIHQARLAFILRDYAYDHRTKRIRFWHPEWLLP